MPLKPSHSTASLFSFTKENSHTHTCSAFSGRSVRSASPVTGRSILSRAYARKESDNLLYEQKLAELMPGEFTVLKKEMDQRILKGAENLNDLQDSRSLYRSHGCLHHSGKKWAEPFPLPPITVNTIFDEVKYETYEDKSIELKSIYATPMEGNSSEIKCLDIVITSLARTIANTLKQGITEPKIIGILSGSSFPEPISQNHSVAYIFYVDPRSSPLSLSVVVLDPAIGHHIPKASKPKSPHFVFSNSYFQSLLKGELKKYGFENIQMNDAKILLGLQADNTSCRTYATVFLLALLNKEMRQKYVEILQKLSSNGTLEPQDIVLMEVLKTSQISHKHSINEKFWELYKSFTGPNGEDGEEYRKAHQFRDRFCAIDDIYADALEPLIRHRQARQMVWEAYKAYRYSFKREHQQKLDEAIKNLEYVQKNIQKERKTPSEWCIRSKEENRELQTYEDFCNLIVDNEQNTTPPQQVDNEQNTTPPQQKENQEPQAKASAFLPKNSWLDIFLGCLPIRLFWRIMSFFGCVNL